MKPQRTDIESHWPRSAPGPAIDGLSIGNRDRSQEFNRSGCGILPADRFFLTKQIVWLKNAEVKSPGMGLAMNLFGTLRFGAFKQISRPPDQICMELNPFY